MATSTLRRPIESVLGNSGENTLIKIGQFGTGASTDEQQYILPLASAWYVVLILRVGANPASAYGMYLVCSYHTSNTNRILCVPVLAVSGGAVFTGGYDAAEGKFVLKLSGLSNEYAYIYHVK